MTNAISKTDCTWNADLIIDPDCYITYEGIRRGSYYKDINLCLRIRTSTPLDYVGSGFEITAPIAFDFITGLNGYTWGHYPPNPLELPLINGLVTPLETTLTLKFKNNEQKIRVYPIPGGWGDRFTGHGFFHREYVVYEDEQYEDYDWTVTISDGIDFRGTSLDILLLDDPQIDLTIKKLLTNGAV